MASKEEEEEEEKKSDRTRQEKKGDRKMESNGSPELSDRRWTSDTTDLPSGQQANRTTVLDE